MMFPQFNFVSVISYAADQTTLTFSDSAIEETVQGSGYEISGTTLMIKSSGTYKVTGSCSEGNIEVKKGTTGVTLILDNLTLACSTTAPIVIKKGGASATVELVGESTITDAEDPDNEASADTETADSFEGAAIKVKSNSGLVITGTGTLNVDGSSCKNGIKGGAASSITINGGTINAEAANNGIACDGTLTINGGTVTVEAQGDGIQAANYLTITDE